MKTSVSIPDQLFHDADTLARRMKQSRSALYACAIAEYLARHSPDHLTEQVNRALAEIDEPPDRFVAAAADRVLRNLEW